MSRPQLSAASGWAGFSSRWWWPWSCPGEVAASEPKPRILLIMPSALRRWSGSVLSTMRMGAAHSAARREMVSGEAGSSVTATTRVTRATNDGRLAGGAMAPSTGFVVVIRVSDGSAAPVVRRRVALGTRLLCESRLERQLFVGGGADGVLCCTQKTDQRDTTLPGLSRQKIESCLQFTRGAGASAAGTFLRRRTTEIPDFDRARRRGHFGGVGVGLPPDAAGGSTEA